MSLSKAVKEKCKECIHDPLDKGSWVQQVENCTSTDCALHPYRPVTSATRELRKNERIANMTPDELAKFNAKSEAARKRMAKLRKSD